VADEQKTFYFRLAADVVHVRGLEAVKGDRVRVERTSPERAYVQVLSDGEVVAEFWSVVGWWSDDGER